MYQRPVPNLEIDGSDLPSTLGGYDLHWEQAGYGGLEDREKSGAVSSAPPSLGPSLGSAYPHRLDCTARRHLPDLWVEPADALDAAARLCRYYGVTGKTAP